MNYLPGQLETSELQRTAGWIASIQRADGLIAHTPGGAADPWNHVEAAMALDVAGHHRAAQAAYEYLFMRQDPNGSVPVDLTDASDARVDTNAVAYLAVGLAHHLSSTGDLSYASARFAAVDRALSYVVGHRLPSGAVAWSVDRDGVRSPRALIAGGSSVVNSLRCGVWIADTLGHDRTGWAEAAAAVASAVRYGGAEFFDNSHFAMDSYYPVLGGVVRGQEAIERLARAAARFETPDGVLCRADRRWVTTAETAELAIAHALVGDRSKALCLLRTVADKRRCSGAYLTGIVYPERSEFPPGEETTYSAAAVVLAGDLLAGGRATRSVFSPDRTRTRSVPHAASTSSMKSPDAMASR